MTVCDYVMWDEFYASNRAVGHVNTAQAAMEYVVNGS